MALPVQITRIHSRLHPLTQGSLCSLHVSHKSFIFSSRIALHRVATAYTVWLWTCRLLKTFFRYKRSSKGFAGQYIHLSARILERRYLLDQEVCHTRCTFQNVIDTAKLCLPKLCTSLHFPNGMWMHFYPHPTSNWPPSEGLQTSNLSDGGRAR